MRTSAERNGPSGVPAGLAAALVLAAAEMVAAGLAGRPLYDPYRMFATLLLGEGALDQSLALVMPVGVLTHLTLAAIYGAVYAFLVRSLTATVSTGLGAGLLLGAVYGFAVWFLDIQTVGRALYPWFLARPAGLQIVMHVVFFGAPLGLFHAALGRRTARRLAHHPA